MPPLQPIDPNIRRTRGGRVEKQKPGPRPKSLYELPPRAYKERVRPKVYRKKPLRAEVLHFLVFHRVYDPQAELAHSHAVVEGHYRAPYFREAQAFFKIPLRTIANWWAKREEFGLSEHRSWRPRWLTPSFVIILSWHITVKIVALIPFGGSDGNGLAQEAFPNGLTWQVITPQRARAALIRGSLAALEQPISAPPRRQPHLAQMPSSPTNRRISTAVP
ncbi:hypothetical protein S40293_11596 [Stachybotrys chartarum IBT 40293]|nr:hypothetical protein S40293_11596 [Stachybotrys chartarum IBT 40293]